MNRQDRPDLPDHLGREPVWPLEQVPPPGQDATLLAVVPIPGTKTSLAIVGYAIATSDALAATATPDVPAQSVAGNSRAELELRPADPAGETGETSETETSGLRLDQLQRRVWADGREVMLTFQEFELLSFLTVHPATVFSRPDLVARVWDYLPSKEKRTRQHRGRVSKQEGRAVQDDSRTVDVHISRIRHKLGRRYGQCLVTEYRVGYQFRPLAP